ncbi:hypothetical protein [Klebsiella quasipneumoniae]|uniref:hypothetical protein n=1 Tax=Klebsiella quasipneumoniae TaxID=1463165 RepID=UPI001D10409E|nr:hypothetical protein [Klebsiella quasipneumoniae]
MAMKQGVTQVANSALDIKDQLCSDMIDAGVDPKQALIASTVATKAALLMEWSPPISCATVGR